MLLVSPLRLFSSLFQQRDATCEGLVSRGPLKPMTDGRTGAPKRHALVPPGTERVKLDPHTEIRSNAGAPPDLGMTLPRFKGAITALATPFDRRGDVSTTDLRKLVELQVSGGIAGLLPVGTTGESPTLSHSEHRLVVEEVIGAAAGRVPVIAGAGSNSTRESVELTRHAHDAGADGTLHVTGYYNKPTQEGLFRHFCAVAEATDKPIVLYSIPGRCVIEIAVDTIERLVSRYPHINHLKEAGGKVERVAQVKSALGDAITVLSGDDALTLPFTKAGGEGVVSVLSNLFPKDVQALAMAALGGDIPRANALQQLFAPLADALFIEPNPVPVKACLEQLGVFENSEVRLPLCELSDTNAARVKDALASTLKQMGAA